MRVKVLQLDEPNANGRIYPTEAIMEAIQKAPDSVLGTIGIPETPEFDLSAVALAANQFRIEDGYLTAEVTVLKTPAGETLQQLIDNGHVAFRPIGYGTVGEDGTISNYTMHSISVLSKDLAA